MNIHKVIKDTKKDVRDLKRTNPHLFPEYQAMLYAEANLKNAKEDLIRAKARWKKVGN